MLAKHGLLGDYKFRGKDGALAFIRQAGCIQFDPVDVCGRNAELTLQSRLPGFTKNMLDELLYADRLLADYPDKNLSIIPIEDWPYFERYRAASRANLDGYPEMGGLIGQARAIISETGPVCSDDLKFEGDFFWRSAIHWSAGGNLSRSVLEQMYTSGDLVVHHKKGTRKYYDLAEKHISLEILNAPEPLHDEFEHQKWRVLRRIGAVGILWNRPSDAWLYIWGLTPAIRGDVFDALIGEGRITGVKVDGILGALYIRAEDMPLLEEVMRLDKIKPRCELIAPLDPMMWDRKLIKALFGFAYSWEIYTPAHMRKYGVYVLPLLYGDRFIGRVEPVRDSKSNALKIKNIWYETGIKQTKTIQSAMEKRLKRFAAFNGCGQIEWLTGDTPAGAP